MVQIEPKKLLKFKYKLMASNKTEVVFEWNICQVAQEFNQIMVEGRAIGWQEQNFKSEKHG